MVTLAFVAALVAAVPVAAQQYPARPVKLVVPFAPGGGSDIVGRYIAQKLSASLAQQVLVENKPNSSVG